MAKQLSLPERIIIERMIHQDYSFASIGRNLDRSASTIAREVLHYRCFSDRIPFPGENDCIHRPGCQKNTLCPEMGVHGCYASRCKRCPDGIICTSICDNYESFQCDLLGKPPYVCSNCKMHKGCKKNKAYYTAHRANAAHQKAIKDAHYGVRKTPAELRKIADIIEPLIAKGQSLNHICATHAHELGISERTLYNYIDQNVFKVRNIDLPKKIVYRQRRPKRVLTKLEYQYRQGRTITDFTSYIDANPDLSIVEMDTVRGSREKGKVLLTMIFRKTSFNKLTVGDVSLVCCHINSVLREQLDDKTPFELMDSADEKKLLSALNLSPIPPDEVILNPKLIKH